MVSIPKTTAGPPAGRLRRREPGCGTPPGGGGPGEGLAARLQGFLTRVHADRRSQDRGSRRRAGRGDGRGLASLRREIRRVGRDRTHLSGRYNIPKNRTRWKKFALAWGKRRPPRRCRRCAAERHPGRSRACPARGRLQAQRVQPRPTPSASTKSIGRIAPIRSNPSGPAQSAPQGPSPPGRPPGPNPLIPIGPTGAGPRARDVPRSEAGPKMDHCSELVLNAKRRML